MINAVIYGYGNIGRATREAIEAAADFQLAGVVSSSLQPGELGETPVVRDIAQLPKPDVVILCAPSEKTPDLAERLLLAGYRTVDSFDMHQHIPAVCERLDKAAKAGHTAAVISAGWDPGVDSVVRALFQAMAEKGHTDTNFGPGMSMGHSTAVKALDGVKDALSVTIPLGNSIHRRMVYVELEPGADFAQVEKAIKSHEYFCHDETHVFAVEDVDEHKDMGHGVHLVRKGVSGKTHNQNFSFSMQINNPALTAQLLLCVARAVLRREPGCYTMLDLPPIDYLPGERKDWIRRLV